MNRNLCKNHLSEGCLTFSSSDLFVFDIFLFSFLTAENFCGFFLQSLPTLHSSRQSLEQMHWFEAIFKMFGLPVFEAIKVPKFWFIWLWYLSFCITYKSKSLRNNKKDKQIRILAHIFRFLWFMPSLGVCSLWSVIATIRHSPASHLCPTFNFISILTLKCFILMMFCLSWDHHC